MRSGVGREDSIKLNGIPVRLQLGSFAAEIHSWGYIPPSQWRNWLHTHTFFEICYAYAGRGTFRMQGQSMRVSAGDVFIAKPGEEHEIIGDRTHPLGIYFWSHTLVPGAATEDAVIDPLLRDFLDSRSWVSRRVPGMRHTLELLTEEAVRREPGYQAVIAGLARKLILDTARAAVGAARAGESMPVVGQSAETALIERARRYLQDNLARAISLRDVAAQTGLSERHFSRLFRRVTGHSPMEYLTERRMEKAGQLLLSGMPIKQIAPKVGISDVRYFTTVFRQATGLPPALYRSQGGTHWTVGGKPSGNTPQEAD